MLFSPETSSSNLPGDSHENRTSCQHDGIAGQAERPVARSPVEDRSSLRTDVHADRRVAEVTAASAEGFEMTARLERPVLGMADDEEKPVAGERDAAFHVVVG